MHRRKHVGAPGREDAGHLGDHPRRVRNEHQRMLMKNDVELSAAKGAQVAHIRPQVIELRPAASRKTAHSRELPARDVHERRRRAKLGKADRVPATATSRREDALSLEIDPFKRAVRDAIEEPPLSSSSPRRRALRPGVWDAGLREPFPHPLVVRGHFVDRNPFGHGEIVAA